MLNTVYRSESPDFTWIDVVAPTAGELQKIAEQFGFHRTSVEDCLDPWHLPKHERSGDSTFVILRAYDAQAPEQGSSVQALTRKIAIFYRRDMVVTIHRVDLPLVKAARERFSTGGHEDACNVVPLLAELINRTLDSYETPLERAEEAIEGFEETLFSPAKTAPPLQRVHVLKRRVNTVKRLLWQTSAVVQHMAPPGDRSAPVFQDLRENAESYYFYADQLLEEINNLLGIHVSLASHRTNEVMRVLTVFSAFFLPLTFIVGIYGMNFRHMPELELWWTYPAVLVLMAGVCAAIAWWFRRRGWLGTR